MIKRINGMRTLSQVKDNCSITSTMLFSTNIKWKHMPKRSYRRFASMLNETLCSRCRVIYTYMSHIISSNEGKYLAKLSILESENQFGNLST